MINNFLLAIILIAVQILIFNQLIFFDKYCPFIYIIWIYKYPIKNNQYNFLFSTFLLGFIIDLFSYSLGIHASSCVFISFLRSSIIKTVFNTKFNFFKNDIDSFSFFEKILLITIIVLIHHFWMFSIEFLEWKYLKLILTNTLYNSLITIIFSLFLLQIFMKL